LEASDIQLDLSLHSNEKGDDMKGTILAASLAAFLALPLTWVFLGGSR
jgi:hypothetical protein